MPEPDDNELLQEYVQRNSQIAFETLVNRYINLVYSTAFRHVRNPDDAREIVQVVFSILAAKAAGLRKETVLPGWLYHTARLTSVSFLRAETRRRRREEMAMEDIFHEQQDPVWEHLAGLLDEAMACLAEQERDALVLRFFQGRTFPEMATLLNQKQSTLQKRVDRSLEKLRCTFVKRGVGVSATALSFAIGTHSVQAAPTGMASMIASKAMAGGASLGPTHVLFKETMTALSRAHLKSSLLGVIAGTLALALATGAITHVSGIWASRQPLFSIQSKGAVGALPMVLVRPTLASAELGWTQKPVDQPKVAGLHVSLIWLLGQAYDLSPSHMVLPAYLPKFEPTLVRDPLTPVQQKALQHEIKKQFGVFGRRQLRESEVLYLKKSQSKPLGLKRSTGEDASIVPMTASGGFCGTNQPLSRLVELIENRLGQPVIDQTGLTNHYDFQLECSIPAGADSAAVLMRVLNEDLGLDLIPGTKPLEVLVVTDQED